MKNTTLQGRYPPPPKLRQVLVCVSWDHFSLTRTPPHFNSTQCCLMKNWLSWLEKKWINENIFFQPQRNCLVMSVENYYWNTYKKFQFNRIIGSWFRNQAISFLVVVLSGYFILPPIEIEEISKVCYLEVYWKFLGECFFHLII